MTIWSRSALGPWLLGAAMLLGAGYAAVAQAPEQTPAAAPASNELTVEAIQARLTKLEENKELDAALKTRLSETYRSILEALRAAGESQARAERFARQAREIPQTLQATQQALAEAAGELPLDLPAEAALTQVQQRLSQVEAELAEAQKSLKELQDEPKRRADRRVEIPRQAETAKTQLQELDQQLQVKPSPDDPVDVTVANRLLLEARRSALLAETAAAQAELRFYEASVELLPLRRDAAARKVTQLESLSRRIRDELNERRRREAERQARESRRVAAQAHPALRAIADRNAELADLRKSLAARIEQAVQQIEQLHRRVEAIENQHDRIARRMGAGQQNQSIGLLLRKQRDELPDVSRERRQMQNRAADIAAASLQLLDYEEARLELAAVDQKVQEALDSVGHAAPPDERLLLEDSIREMLLTQRAYLDALIVDSNSYLDALVDLDARNRELIDRTQEFAKFIDERIFWIRSAPVLSDVSPARVLWPGVQRLISLRHWQTLAETLWRQCLARPWATGIALLAWLACLAGQRSLRRRLTDLGKQASRGTCRTFVPTLQALWVTTLLAVTWPALAALVGWQLLTAEPSTEFAVALGRGLLVVALLFAALEWLRKACRPAGLGEDHFGWEPTTVRNVRQGLEWLIAVGLPLTLIVVVTESQSNESLKHGLGRVTFLVLNLFLLIPVWQTMHPDRGVLAAVYRMAPEAWWSRLRWLWFTILMLAPPSLIIAASLGYYYTAVQLAARMLMTLWLIAGLVVMYGLLLRWSLIAYRDLGMKRLQERRAAAAEAASPTAPHSQNAPLEIKLADINQQTRRILHWVVATGLVAGAWGIWVTVVPALGALRHVELWTHEVRSTAGVVLAPITLADLILSSLVLVLTVALSRNVPSLLELTLLKQLPLDPGARYAVSTVAKYVITAVGLAVAFSTLGFDWSQVQWLVAAVGVGLGFGLQEIFANFVSGLVLLFERPIRIGDIVTVGEVTGKVSNIRMRATTITDWDMRELVVPNKEFITARVINWTLSTTVSRMSIHVGVAYGTNPDLVRTTLLEAAAANSLVLKTPPPHALLDEFSASTLLFVLRVYMPSRDVYLQLRHELMADIAARFQQAGIVIAFPQCDVHLNVLSRPEGGTGTQAHGVNGAKSERASAAGISGGA